MIGAKVFENQGGQQRQNERFMGSPVVVEGRRSRLIFACKNTSQS